MEKIKLQEKNLNVNNEGEDKKCEDPYPYKYTRQAIYGWDSAMSVASDVWSSVHASLLNGELIFAYKNTTGDSELAQIVVVLNVMDKFGNRVNTLNFGVGTVTLGYTSLLPHVPIEYLENQVIQDLKKYKVNKKIIESFIEIIKNYKQ